MGSRFSTNCRARSGGTTSRARSISWRICRPRARRRSPTTRDTRISARPKRRPRTSLLLPSPAEEGNNSADNRDPLHLDQHFGAREARHGDESAGREVVAKNLATQLRETVAEPRVGDEHRHCHHIGELAAGLFQGTSEPGEYLAHLAVEIGGERAPRRVFDRHLAGEPGDAAAALGRDRLRITARLRGLALQIISLHCFWHSALPSFWRGDLRPLEWDRQSRYRLS